MASVAPASPARPARVRRAAVAGAFYPRDPGDLAAAADGFLAAAPKVKLFGGPVRALVAPHAGYGYSGGVAARAFKLVQGQTRRRVIVIGPAHRADFAGAAIEDFTHYRTPLGDVPVDGDAVAVLRAQAGLGEHGGAGAGEHSIEVMLPLLQRALRPGWMLVPVLVGSVDPGAARALAETLRPFADDDTLVVASGDLTHYGHDYDYVPFPLTPALPAKLAALDRGFYDRILDLDPEGLAAYRDRTSINACGFGPFLVLASLLSHDVRPVLLRYETSGANTGSYTTSVSYAAMVFSGPRAPRNASEALPRRDMKVLLDLAIRAIDRAVRTGSTIDAAVLHAPGPIDARLEADGASFVTLTAGGNMRGCVGDLEAREPLWRSVVHTAVQAALRDVRFDPVQPQELARLEVEVSVIGPLRSIASPAEIRLGADGVLLEKGLRTGAFLPEIPVQQGWSLEMLLDALAAKAQIPRHGWRDGARLRVFVTQTLSGRMSR